MKHIVALSTFSLFDAFFLNFLHSEKTFQLNFLNDFDDIMDQEIVNFRQMDVIDIIYKQCLRSFPSICAGKIRLLRDSWMLLSSI